MTISYPNNKFRDRSMEIEHLINKKIDSLPPLPQTVIKLQEVTNDPTSSVKQFAEVVQEDPLLTANLLKTANSPYYGFTSKVTSVTHAVALFGMQTVLSFALSQCVKKNFKTLYLQNYGLTPEDFSKSAYLQNKLMLQWKIYLDFPEKEILTSAAFLNEIGKVVLAEIVNNLDFKDDFIAEIKESSFNYLEIEKKYFNITTPEVSARILYKWRLHIELVNFIRASINPKGSDEYLQPYGYSIQAVRTVVGPKGNINKESIYRSMAILKEAELNERHFLLALKQTITSN